MIRVYRIQDSDGRGPWRPGFGSTWSDPDSTTHLDPSFQPFNPQAVQNVLKTVPTLRYFGFGCRTIDALRDWFTPKELDTLLGMGFQVVRLEAERMLFETKRQLLFARSQPLTIGATPVLSSCDIVQAMESTLKRIEESTKTVQIPKYHVTKGLYRMMVEAGCCMNDIHPIEGDA